MEAKSQLFGSKIFNVVKSLSVTATTGTDTVEEYLRTPDSYMKVNAIRAEVWHGGTKILPTALNLDNMTVQLQDVGESDSLFASNPIHVFTLNKLGSGDNFRGFVFEPGKRLKITFVHDGSGAGNITSGTLELRLIFSGKKIEKPEGRLLSLSRQFYNHCMKFTIPVDSDGVTLNMPAPGLDMAIDQMAVEVINNGTIIQWNSASQDKLNLKMEELQGDNLFGTGSMDVFSMEEVGMNINFEGFNFDAETDIEATVSHSSVNETSNAYTVKLIFSGSPKNGILF